MVSSNCINNYSTRDYLHDLACEVSFPVAAFCPPGLLLWGAPEAITFYRDYCAWLIAAAQLPCNRVAPDPVACLGDQGVFNNVVEILLPRCYPRARRRRRARTTVRGRSNDPDGDPEPESNRRPARYFNRGRAPR